MAKRTKTFCSSVSVRTYIVLTGMFISQLFGVTTQPYALDHTGTYQLQAEGTNLRGNGVTIASVCRSLTYLEGEPQNDFLFNVEHNCFSTGTIEFISSLKKDKGISAHATSIGAILAGNDSNAFFEDIGEFVYSGACPDSVIDVYEFWYFVSNYIYGNKPFDADILTLSVGMVFDSEWSRGLEKLVDQKGLIVVAGIGNGSDVYDSVLYPGIGPNVIGVGVVDSVSADGIAGSVHKFTLPRSNHSSMGPSSDGRCGPDLVAPGNCLVPQADSSEGYTVSGDWTSFATPVVSGTIALLVESAKSDPVIHQEFTRRAGNCIVRSILLTSATKLPYWHKGGVSEDDDHEFSLDFVQGAGMLNAVGANDLLLAGIVAPGESAVTGWDRGQIDNAAGSAKSYTIDLADSDDEYLTATLVWNRHYRNKYPYKAMFDKDSDLRLELWADDPENPGTQVLVDYSDSVDDNIEHIHFKLDRVYDNFQLVVLHSDAGGQQRPGKVESYAVSWRTSSNDETLESLWYDINGDGAVDTDDVIALMVNDGKSPEVFTDGLNDYLIGDINLDGLIDVHDIALLLKNNPSLTGAVITQ